MRLTREQKQAALDARPPGAKLVRVLTEWYAVWHMPEFPRRERWRAQRLSKVIRHPDGSWVPWWNAEVGAHTKRDAIRAAIGDGAP